MNHHHPRIRPPVSAHITPSGAKQRSARASPEEARRLPRVVGVAVRAERGLELLDSGPVASISSAIVLAAISERSVVYYTSEPTGTTALQTAIRRARRTRCRGLHLA
ncbi:hypothetical protein VTO73DRAFT_4110 [Trametes versicolor]